MGADETPTFTITQSDFFATNGLEEVTAEHQRGVALLYEQLTQAGVPPEQITTSIQSYLSQTRQNQSDYLRAFSPLSGRPDIAADAPLSFGPATTVDEAQRQMHAAAAVITNFTNTIGSAISSLPFTGEFEGIENPVEAVQRNQGTVSDAQAYFYEMTEEEFRKLQYDLYRAGKYDSVDDIPWGNQAMDETAWQEWNTAIISAFERSSRSGTPITPRNIINEMVKSQGPDTRIEDLIEAREAEIRLRQGEINRTDPNALIQAAKTRYRALTGRDPDEATLRAMVDYLDSETIAAQQREIAASNQVIIDETQRRIFEIQDEQELARREGLGVSDQERGFRVDENDALVPIPESRTDRQRNQAEQRERERLDNAGTAPQTVQGFNPDQSLTSFIENNFGEAVRENDFIRTGNLFLQAIRRGI
jgi:hypothetical protein